MWKQLLEVLMDTKFQGYIQELFHNTVLNFCGFLCFRPICATMLISPFCCLLKGKKNDAIFSATD